MSQVNVCQNILPLLMEVTILNCRIYLESLKIPKQKFKVEVRSEIANRN